MNVLFYGWKVMYSSDILCIVKEEYSQILFLNINN